MAGPATLHGGEQVTDPCHFHELLGEGVASFVPGFAALLACIHVQVLYGTVLHMTRLLSM